MFHGMVSGGSVSIQRARAAWESPAIRPEMPLAVDISDTPRSELSNSASQRTYTPQPSTSVQPTRGAWRLGAAL